MNKGEIMVKGIGVDILKISRIKTNLTVETKQHLHEVSKSIMGDADMADINVFANFSSFSSEESSDALFPNSTLKVFSLGAKESMVASSIGIAFVLA